MVIPQEALKYLIQIKVHIFFYSTFMIYQQSDIVNEDLNIRKLKWQHGLRLGVFH